MLKFAHFLIERQTVDSSSGDDTGLRPTMVSDISKEDAKRHLSNYLNKTKIANTTYVLAKSHGDLAKGSKIKITGTEIHDNIIHATTSSGESIPIHKIHKPGERYAPGERHEKLTAARLQDQLESYRRDRGSAVPVSIDGTIHHITHFEHVTGGGSGINKPKSDMIAHAINPKTGESYQVHISLKSSDQLGGTQQYGGVSHLTPDHPTIKKFIDRVKSRYSKSGAYAMNLNPNDEHERELSLSSMFGREHGSNQSGLHSVSHIVSGNANIVSRNGTLQLTAGKILSNPSHDSSLSDNEKDNLRTKILTNNPTEINVRNAESSRNSMLGKGRRIGIYPAGGLKRSQKDGGVMRVDND